MALHRVAGHAVAAKLAQAVVGDLTQARVAGVRHQDEGVQRDGGDDFGVWRRLGPDLSDDLGLGGLLRR